MTHFSWSWRAFAACFLVASSVLAGDPPAPAPPPPPRLGEPLGAEQWQEFASGWRPFDANRTRVYSAAVREAVERAKAAAAAGRPYSEVEEILAEGLRRARQSVGAETDSYGRPGPALGGSWPVYDYDLKSGGGTVDDEVAAAAKRFVESSPNQTVEQQGNTTRVSATRMITLPDGTVIEGTKVTLVIDKATGNVVRTTFTYPGAETAAKVHARLAQLYAKAMNPATSPAEAFAAASEAFYLTENTVPYVRGGSSMGELLFKTMVESRGIPTGAVKPGFGWDLLAWTRSLDEWRAQLPEYFRGGSPKAPAAPGALPAPAPAVPALGRPPACKSPVAPPRPAPPALPAEAPEPGAPVAAAAPPGAVAKPTWGSRTGFTKPGLASVPTQLKGQGAGVGLAVVATGVGKIVEKETGDPLLGAGAGASVAVAGGAGLAKMGGAPVIRSVGGGLLAGVGGTVVRESVKGAGGSQTSGDIAGYATAGAIGAAFGGPIGAGGAVIAMAASDGVAAGIDWAYAAKEDEQLDAARRAQAVNRDFRAILNRNLNANPLSSRDYWENLAATEEGRTQMRRHLAEAATPQIYAIYQAQLGRMPSPAELQAAKNALIGGSWITDVERNISFARAAFNSALGREPNEADLIAYTGALGTGMKRETMLRELASVPEAEARIREIYQRAQRRDPSPAELATARDQLARGEGLRAVENRINFP